MFNSSLNIVERNKSLCFSRVIYDRSKILQSEKIIYLSFMTWIEIISIREINYFTKLLVCRKNIS